MMISFLSLLDHSGREMLSDAARDTQITNKRQSEPTIAVAYDRALRAKKNEGIDAEDVNLIDAGTTPVTRHI